jgi:hypothetical protein
MRPHLPQNLAGGIASRDPHDPSSRMAASAAQIQACEWRLVLGCAGDRPHHQELIESEIRVMPMPAGDTELPLNIDRRQ